VDARRTHGRRDPSAGPPEIDIGENVMMAHNVLIADGNVEELFRQAGVPERIDVLSIDIYGNDFWVWEAIEHHEPRVVVIEYNANLALDSRLVMPRDDAHARDPTDYFGASLALPMDCDPASRPFLDLASGTLVDAPRPPRLGAR
jgi:hypothetical protein